MAALDFPNSPTLNQLYAAPNGTTYKWDGVAWIVGAAGPPTELWTDTGTALTPYDATKTVTVPGVAGKGALVAGTRTMKTRLQAATTVDANYFSSNMALNAAETGYVLDDTSKPGWMISEFLANDQLLIARVPAGGTASTNLLALDNTGNLTATAGVTAGNGTLSLPPRGLLLTNNANNFYIGANWSSGPNFDSSRNGWLIDINYVGNAFTLFHAPPGASSSFTSFLQVDGSGNLIIAGSIGQKASGTTWANPSDPRLKQDVAPYAAGLADICQLAPITYRLKAHGPDGPLCYGFDAEQVRDVFPECVSTTKMKLDPADEEETEGVLVFDMHPILVALVNAVM